MAYLAVTVLCLIFLYCVRIVRTERLMLWIFGDLQILYVINLLLKTPGSELTRVLGHREASPLPYHTDQETEDEKKKISARFLRQSDPFLGYFELD